MKLQKPLYFALRPFGTFGQVAELLHGKAREKSNLGILHKKSFENLIAFDTKPQVG